MIDIRLLTVSLLFLTFQPVIAQGFKVKSFTQAVNDGSAFHAPLDAQGHPCGLIKVRTDNAELKFRGNIVGEIENKTNEYWVHLAPGSKQLSILHPNFLPMLLDFRAYGIDEVSSKSTYIMVLSEQKFNREKTSLVVTVKPETSTLYIDDALIENLGGHGLYQLYIPKGDHICRIEQEGYRPNVQVMTTGKGTQNLTVELESVMSELEIKCKTSTAEIYLDGELKGNGIWKGMVLAGEHQIESRQPNMEPFTQIITLSEKEARSIVLSELKRLKRMITIETEPTGMPVIVDGELQGKSPIDIEIETGSHYVICNPMGHYGCETLREELLVTGEKSNIFHFSLKYNTNEEYQKAYAGDIEAVVKLACERYWWNDEFFDEALFWASKIPNVEKMYERIKFDGSDNSHTLALLCAPERMEEVLRTEEQKEPNEIWKKDLAGFGSKLAQEYGYLGDSYKKRGEYDKAIECYKKGDRDYRYESIGDCYVLKGNVIEAVKQYKMCLRGVISDYTRSHVEKKIRDLEKQ